MAWKSQVNSLIIFLGLCSPFRNRGTSQGLLPSGWPTHLSFWTSSDGIEICVPSRSRLKMLSLNLCSRLSGMIKAWLHWDVCRKGDVFWVFNESLMFPQVPVTSASGRSWKSITCILCWCKKGNGSGKRNR